MFVGLLMVGCGEDAPKEAQQEDEAEKNNVAPLWREIHHPRSRPDNDLGRAWNLHDGES